MRTYGLIGKNIDYSFSRRYFSEKFANENLQDEYRNFDIPNVSEFSKVISNNVIAGLNVTIPYKEAIIPYLDHLDPHAQKIQAVNTIKFEKDGSLTGYNTDFWGFLEALKPHLQSFHTNALILGTGGASKAIAYALDILEIDYKFVSRDPDGNQFSYKDLNKKILGIHNLIINTTPLGTFPNITDFPAIPFQHINEKHLIFDLIYNPAETQLMQKAAKNGARTLNGLQMLKLQAERAWNIWNS